MQQQRLLRLRQMHRQRSNMKTLLKNYRQSPRKVRIVADLVRGKKVKEAVSILSFLEKRAALPMKSALLSAVANAKAQGKDPENLFVKTIAVDKGTVLKRLMPRARGSGARINKRSSHIAIHLGEKAPKSA